MGGPWFERLAPGSEPLLPPPPFPLVSGTLCASSAVRSAMFSVDGLRVLTGSDDKTARLWDLPTSTTVATLDGHGDYVRAQAPSMASPHLWATGSYDHILRLFDLRKQAPIFSLDHGYPVRSTLQACNLGP